MNAEFIDVVDDMDSGGAGLAEAEGANDGNRCLHDCAECCSSFCRGLKSCLSFLVSHMGLMTIVVGYCLAGAVIFEKIEKENELQVGMSETKVM